MLKVGPYRFKEVFFPDTVDGAILNSHPLFSEKPNALHIVLYMDEIKICNPIIIIVILCIKKQVVNCVLQARKYQSKIQV